MFSNDIILLTFREQEESFQDAVDRGEENEGFEQSFNNVTDTTEDVQTTKKKQKIDQVLHSYIHH